MRLSAKMPRPSGRLFATFRNLLLCLLLVAMPTSALAALNCTAQTSAVSFGTYNPSALLANDSSGSVQLRCSCSGLDCLAFTYTIEIAAGTSGSVSDRRMFRSGETSGGLQYRLYRDGTRLLPWDVGSNKLTVLYALGLFGNWQSVTVFGRAPAGQAVASGGYSDNPGIVISY